MSFLIEYVSGQLRTAKMGTPRSTPSPSYVSNDGKTFGVGDFFGLTFDKLAETDWQNNPVTLNSVEGTKALARADADGCKFAVDQNGIDTFLYYYDGSRFLLSDSFWDIVRKIQPKYEDLNIAFIRQSLLTCTTPNGSTYLKYMHFLLPSYTGFYNAKENVLQVQRYRDFHYSRQITDISEAVEHLDNILHRTMEQIKEKCGDVQYAVGLSGGLDSRVIPHYAKAHGMRLTAFNFCISRPNGIFLGQSVKNARALAKVFDIPYKEVEWDIHSLDDKFRLVTKLFPYVSSREAFKYEPQGLPEFDVLLSGGSGMIVGSELPTDLFSADRNRLINLFNAEFLPHNSATFSNRAKRALVYIFGDKFVNIDTVAKPSYAKGSLLSQFITEDDRGAVETRIASFISDKLQLGSSNVEIYEDFFINVVGFLNRFGSYESFLGTKRSFSIYIPFLLTEVLTWDPALLLNRKVLTELILRKIPEVAGVRSESFETSPRNKSCGAFFKGLSVLEFLIRGNGTAIDQLSFRKKNLQKRFLSEIEQEKISLCWFNKIFQIEKKEIPISLITPSSSGDAIKIWQLKHTIDCLEKKEYMNFN